MRAIILGLVFVALVSVCSSQNDNKDVAVRNKAVRKAPMGPLNKIRKTNPSIRNQARKNENGAVPHHSNQKRQLGRFGSSSSQAQANAFNQQFGKFGFGSSAANAGAQSFFSQGPGGGFGASAANAASQGFQVGPGGITGSAGHSGSQSYVFGNRQINIAYSNGFSLVNGKPSISQGNSISFS